MTQYVACPCSDCEMIQTIVVDMDSHDGCARTTYSVCGQLYKFAKECEKRKQVPKDFGDVIEKITGKPCERSPWSVIVRYNDKEE